jgi:hypothetical protein
VLAPAEPPVVTPPVPAPLVSAPPVPVAPPLDGTLRGQPPSGRNGSPIGHVFEKASPGSELHDSIARATLVLRKRIEIADIVPGSERAACAPSSDSELAYALA